MSKLNRDTESLSMLVENFTDAMVEVMYRKNYKEIVSFEEIAKYAIEEKKKNSKIAAFIISVKKNYDPKTENDEYIIIQGLLDKNNRPIVLNGKDSESRIIHTKTIDKKFLEVLNGSETKIVRI